MSWNKVKSASTMNVTKEAIGGFDVVTITETIITPSKELIERKWLEHVAKVVADIHNIIKEYCQDTLVIDDKGYTSVSELFRNFRAWFIEGYEIDIGEIYTKAGFKKFFIKLGYKVEDGKIYGVRFIESIDRRWMKNEVRKFTISNTSTSINYPKN